MVRVWWLGRYAQADRLEDVFHIIAGVDEEDTKDDLGGDDPSLSTADAREKHRINNGRP